MTEPLPLARPRTPRSRVESIGVGLEILKDLARLGGEATLTQIAAATSEPPPKVHRYLMGLLDGGLVEQTGTGTYRLAADAMAIGFAAVQANQPVALAGDRLPRLRDALDASCCVAVLGNMGPTVVRVEEAVGAIVLNIRLGTVLPLLSSAMGRVFAAFARDQATLTRIRSAPRPDPEPEQPIEDVRRQGYAWVKDSLRVGTSALSVPIFDRNGDVAVAIAALGPTGTLDLAPSGQAVPLLRETARELSARLGWTSPSGPDTV